MKKEIVLMFTILLFFLCVVFGILTYIPDHKISQTFEEIFTTFEVATRAVITIAGIAISLAAITGLIWSGWIAYSAGVVWWYNGKIKRVEWLKQLREAALVITVAPPGSQVYSSEIGGELNFVHKPLYLAANNVNGASVEPTINQVKNWFYFQATQSIAKPDKTIIEGNLPQLQAPLPEHVDLSDYINGAMSIDSLFLGIGRMPDGRIEPIRRPLNTLVHVACGGGSGFGKSIFMQSLAYQVIRAKEPIQATFLDAQGVTFQVFSDSDKLRYPVASEEKDIQAILADLLGEMHRRKDLYARWRGVFSLMQYNNVADESLPVLPIFFDEFGLLAGSKEIAKLVDLIAKGGRKFGLYFLASSQTWYSNEIASSLKANLSSAIQFHVPGKSQSRVLLEDSRAVELTKPGQAYCRLPGQVGLIELMAPDCSSLIDVSPVLMDAPIIDMPVIEVKPDEREQTILDMADNGASLSEIARQVYGSTGGKQIKLIKDVLEKFE